MKLFKCKVCEEKDTLIASMRSEIAFLRSLVAPAQTDKEGINVEANKMLDGASLPSVEYFKEPNQEETFEKISVEREATRILSGMYVEL